MFFFSLLPIKTESSENEELLKLPELKLQRFESGYVESAEFFNLFQAQIGNRKNLLNVQKFSFLKSQLTGRALATIVALKVNKDNYEAAIEKLRRRFESEKDNIFQLIDKVIRLPKFRHFKWHLRCVFDFPGVIDKHGASLTCQYDFLLRHLIRKLPGKWIHQGNSLLPFLEIPTITILLEFLEREMNSFTSAALHSVKLSRGKGCEGTRSSGANTATSHRVGECHAPHARDQPHQSYQMRRLTAHQLIKTILLRLLQ